MDDKERGPDEMEPFLRDLLGGLSLIIKDKSAWNKGLGLILVVVKFDRDKKPPSMDLRIVAQGIEPDQSLIVLEGLVEQIKDGLRGGNYNSGANNN